MKDIERRTGLVLNTGSGFYGKEYIAEGMFDIQRKIKNIADTYNALVDLYHVIQDEYNFPYCPDHIELMRFNGKIEETLDKLREPYNAACIQAGREGVRNDKWPLKQLKKEGRSVLIGLGQPITLRL